MVTVSKCDKETRHDQKVKGYSYLKFLNYRQSQNKACLYYEDKNMHLTNLYPV